MKIDKTETQLHQDDITEPSYIDYLSLDRILEGKECEIVDCEDYWLIERPAAVQLEII